MVRGDLAIECHDPHRAIENERKEPSCMEVGPRQGDVLLVRTDGSRAACKVLEVGNKRGRPLYTVEYDDGMLVQDHLVVPWSYLSTAPPAQSDPPTDGSASDADTVAPPMSAKAKGKRRMIDVMAEAAETMQTPPPAEAGPVPSPPSPPER